MLNARFRKHRKLTLSTPLIPHPQSLVTHFQRSLKNPEAMSEFRTISAMFRDGMYNPGPYYEHCKAALGDKFTEIFPELVALLPNITKQQVCCPSGLNPNPNPNYHNSSSVVLGTVPGLLPGGEETTEECRFGPEGRWQVLHCSARSLPGVQTGPGAGRSDGTLPVALHGEQLPQVGCQRETAGGWQGVFGFLAKIVLKTD